MKAASDLVYVWQSLSWLEDVLYGEPQFPLRSWWCRRHGSQGCSGKLWTQHNESMAEVSALLRKTPAGEVLVVGCLQDCGWLDEFGRRIEIDVRAKYPSSEYQWPGYDANGLGWSFAVAATPGGEWRDVTDRDPQMTQFRHLLAGVLGDECWSAESVSNCWFRSLTRRAVVLERAVGKLLNGESLSRDDMSRLAVAVSVERAVELQELTGLEPRCR